MQGPTTLGAGGPTEAPRLHAVRLRCARCALPSPQTYFDCKAASNNSKQRGVYLILSAAC